MKFVGCLKFVKIREFVRLIKFIKFEFSTINVPYLLRIAFSVVACFIYITNFH